MDLSNVYSIGHGNKSIKEFIEELSFFEIEYLIDVRTMPYSKYSPHFNQKELANALKVAGLEYLFMGNELGGLPKDESCYTNGHVDYEKIKTKEFFKKGIKRLVSANLKKIKVAIMCSEIKPEECHRSKLIGVELSKVNIEVNHIVRSKKNPNHIVIKSQENVMSELFPNGVLNLFGEAEVLYSKRKIDNDPK